MRKLFMVLSLLFIAVLAAHAYKYDIAALYPFKQSTKYDLQVTVKNSLPNATVLLKDDQVNKTDGQGNAENYLTGQSSGERELIVKNNLASLTFPFELKEPSRLVCQGAEKLTCEITPLN